MAKQISNIKYQISNIKYQIKRNLMDLKEFVSQTIIQIIDGIKLAQEEYPENACPEMVKFHTQSPVINQVDFDVAIYASDDKETGAKAGIKVMSFISASGESKSNSSTGSSSRIKFQVPIRYPTPK